MRKLKFKFIEDGVIYPLMKITQRGIEVIHTPSKRKVDVIQYTELDDINGEEIYDGHILECGGLYYLLEKQNGGAYQLVSKEDKFSPRFLLNHHSQVKVVGHELIDKALAKKLRC